MTSDIIKTPTLTVARLHSQSPTRFELIPSAKAREQIATLLELQALPKLRFAGAVSASGADDWQLQGQLGASVVQSCVLSLEPVRSRIDVPVTRLYLADFPELGGEEEEIEMTIDENCEALGSVIDLEAVMVEALSLALPLYPKAEGASLQTTQSAPPGVTPLDDEATHPFAGLAALRDKMQGGE
ncbi:MAG: hypothetical protein CSA68_00160 [Rhodobacterales bacterium]|nr:MAG: hypothetical protein CSA68_00160 [Rhodobacterales bacterium]